MLKALRRIIQEVNAADDLKSALQIVVQQVKDEVDTDACSIYLADHEKGEYVLSATDGLNQRLIGKARLKFGEGLIGTVGERAEPINLDDAFSHSNFRYYPGLNEENLRAYLGVPLIFQRQLVGVLVIQQKEPRRFDETEEAFLMTLATQLAVTIADIISTSSSTEFKFNTTAKIQIIREFKDTIIDGIPSAPGVGIGKIVVVYPPADLDAVPDRYIDDIAAEIELFTIALNTTRDQIKQLGETFKSGLSSAELALFEAYTHILEGGRLVNGIFAEIRNGRSAESALKHVVKKNVQQFEAMDDPYLQERAADLRDLGRRLLAQLQAAEQINIRYLKDTILFGEEISPADLAGVPEGHLAGIISIHGSSHSHVSILARALGVPTVLGISGISVLEVEGLEAIIDGYNGQIYLAPSEKTRNDFIDIIKHEQELDAEIAKLTDIPAQTMDGHIVSLYVNTGLLADVSRSLMVGAEGVGLYRTEVPFMMRDSFPTEEEQRIVYRRVLGAFAPRHVSMRTLDIGGDKPLSYFPIDDENPFLGWRGIRVTLDHPEIFLVQLRAMIRASIGLDNLRILLPMISSIGEVEEAYRLMTQAYEEIAEVEPSVKMPKLGIMIEVPSAIYQIKQLARKVNFISVGSNDLTQYILAVDRNNARVANLYDNFHPAVLQAMMQVITSARKEKIPVGICGEMAGDPLAVVLLLAMGFDSLSMSASRLPRVKWVIRKFSLKQAKSLLRDVMLMDDAREIRGHMELALEEVGLGGLIRAGK